jgi:hypothetical protein
MSGSTNSESWYVGMRAQARDLLLNCHQREKVRNALLRRQVRILERILILGDYRESEKN